MYFSLLFLEEKKQKNFNLMLTVCICKPLVCKATYVALRNMARTRFVRVVGFHSVKIDGEGLL